MDAKNIAVLFCICLMGINGFLIVSRKIELTDIFFGKEPSETKRIFGAGFWFLLSGILIWSSLDGWFK